MKHIYCALNTLSTLNKNISRSSYLDRLKCARFSCPWAQSNSVFFNSYVCFIPERAQSLRKMLNPCAFKRGTGH